MLRTPNLEEKRRAVEKLLSELGLNRIPCLIVLNKSDLIDPEEALALKQRYEGVPVSALNKSGMDELVKRAEARLAG